MFLTQFRQAPWVPASRGTVRAWANSTADLGSWEVRWSPTDKARTGFRPGRSHHAGNVLDVRYGGVLNGKTPIAGWFMMENPKHIQQIGLGRRHRKPWFSPFKCVFSCKCSLQFRERFHFWMIHPITVIHVNYLIFSPYHKPQMAKKKLYFSTPIIPDSQKMKVPCHAKIPDLQRGVEHLTW